MIVTRTIITYLCFGLLSMSLLTACGGGGGSTSNSTSGGDGSGGSKTFDISSTDVSLEVDGLTAKNDLAVAQITIKSDKVAYMGAAFSGSKPDWLSANIVGGPGKSFTLTLSAFAYGITEGTFTTNVQVGSANTKGDLLDTVNVRVTMKVQMPLAFGQAAPSFNRVFASSDAKTSSPIYIQAGSNLNWSLSSNQSWLSTDTTTSKGNQDVTLKVDSTGLAIGHYEAILTLSNNDNSRDTRTKVITLDVVEPSFELSATEITLGGELGFEQTAPQLSASMNTGSTDYNLSLKFIGIDPNLLSSSISTLSSKGNKTINLQAKPGLLPGRYQGQVEATATIAGHVMKRNLDLIVKKEERKLLADYYGVALSNFPSKSVLERNITIRANAPGEVFAWKASTNQPWLNVNSSGLTGDSLQITADPSALAPNQFYEAIITVTPNDTLTQKSFSIRVGLWAGSADAPNQNIKYDPYQIETSPVEPWVIGLDSMGTYHIHNIFTGDLVRSFPSTNATYKDFAISADGRKLIEYTQQELIAYSLANGTEIARYAFGNQHNRDLAYISYTMPNGTPTIITGGGHIINLDTGSWQTYEALSTYADGFISVAPQNNKFYVATYNHTTFYDLKSSNVNTTPYLVATESSHSDITNGQDVAVTHDGSRVYAAGGGGAGTPGYQFIYYDAMNPSIKNYINGGAYPNNVETSWSGVFATGLQAYYDELDTFIYDADLRPLKEFKCAGTTYTEIWANNFHFSGDNTRLACATRNNGRAHYGIFIHNLY